MIDSTNNQLVSIIVRTKDRPKLLTRALQSIADQTYRPIEVVLVNDGGCDLDIPEISTLLGDVSLNYQRLGKNTGRARAGNIGIENAKGEYVGFLDDDDEFYPDHVASLVFFLENNHGYSGAYSDSEIIRRQYDRRGEIVAEVNDGLFKSTDFSYALLLFENYITLICSLLKRDIIKDVGGFDESFEMFEDWDLYVKVAEKQPLYHIPKVTTKYVQWNPAGQIAFVGLPEARNCYLKVLSKHLNKISPTEIYYYFTVKQGLEKEVGSKSNSPEDFLRAKQALETANQKLEEEVRAKNVCLEGVIRDKQALERANQVLTENVRARDRYIEEVHHTFGWRLLEYYRKNIKKKLFPTGTRREKICRFVLKGLLAFRVKGAKVAFEKIKDKFRQRRARKKLKSEKFIIPVITGAFRETLNRKVSVVIPTKNAGGEFRSCLEKIRNQRGLKEVEIIVVDSGSADETLDIAKRYNAKILRINPEDFNHGAVRNIGAGEATGDYILFMSQDVVAAGDGCIYEIIKIMEKDSLIAAATVKQIPRSDADLFACWQLWYYYNKVIGLSGDHISSVDPKDLDKISPEDKRKISQIDNIFSCVKKDVFDRFMFNPLPYAEDLDLGLRLISKGYKIAFFSSIGTIHSHNRNPSYYFRRSFVDIKSIAELLGFEPIDWDDYGITSSEHMFLCIYAFYLKVNSVANMLKKMEVLKQPVEQVIDRVKSCLRDKDMKGSFRGEESLDNLFRQIIPEKHIDFYSCNSTGVFLSQYIDLLDSLGEFLGISGNMDGRKEEFIPALYKIFAVIGGSNMGNFAVYSRKRQFSEKSFEKMASVLDKDI